jgi:hypothetical protein
VLLGIVILFATNNKEETQNYDPKPVANRVISNGGEISKYYADENGYANMTELGIRIPISDELKNQLLTGYVTTENDIKSIYFTTEYLKTRYPTCDGLSNWVGFISRYDGQSSDQEHQHHHGGTVVDLNGFHIILSPPERSCISSYLGYSGESLDPETTATKDLQQAVLRAEQIN